MAKKQSDYSTCVECTHTENIHVGPDHMCCAYMCNCEGFE